MTLRADQILLTVSPIFAPSVPFFSEGSRHFCFSSVCFHIPTLLFPRTALNIFVPFYISLIHVVSNRIHACLNHSVTEVRRVETFQRIRLCLPASMRSVQCAGLSLCLRRHYWGLLRHDPQRRSHWNEGEQNILTLTRAQFWGCSLSIWHLLNLGSANWSRIAVTLQGWNSKCSWFWLLVTVSSVNNNNHSCNYEISHHVSSVIFGQRCHQLFTRRHLSLCLSIPPRLRNTIFYKVSEGHSSDEAYMVT